MNTYDEYEDDGIYEYEPESEYDRYNDPDGYTVYVITRNISYWFRTYEEMIEPFNELVIWDHVNEMYILHPQTETESEFNCIVHGYKNGFEAFDVVENNILWFRTYEEMMDEFGEFTIWDEEKEMYIIQQHEEHEEHEEDEEMLAFLGDEYGIEMETTIVFDDHYTTKEL